MLMLMLVAGLGVRIKRRGKRNIIEVMFVVDANIIKDKDKLIKNNVMLSELNPEDNILICHSFNSEGRVIKLKTS